MSLFRQPRPRPFHHRLVYTDERRNRLRNIEQRARQELGLDSVQSSKQPSDSDARQRLKGTFLAATSHTRRRVRHQQRASLSRFNIVLLLFLLAIALVVLKVLMAS